MGWLKKNNPTAAMRNILKVTRFDDGTVQEVVHRDGLRVETYYKSDEGEARANLEQRPPAAADEARTYLSPSSSFSSSSSSSSAVALGARPDLAQGGGRGSERRERGCRWNGCPPLAIVLPVLANLIMCAMLAWYLNPLFSPWVYFNCTNSSLGVGNCSNFFGCSRGNLSVNDSFWPPGSVVFGKDGCAVSASVLGLVGPGVLCNGTGCA